MTQGTIQFGMATISRGNSFNIITTTEFVDNSIPFSPKNIELDVKSNYVLYKDDGINHISETNFKHLLTYGRREDVGYKKLTGVGCYGMGMNATCSSISKSGKYQFECWSDEGIKTIIKVDSVSTNWTTETVDVLPHLEHKGFCIFIEDTDLIDAKSIANIRKKFSHRYSIYIGNGLNIFVNGTKIKYEDPLYRDLVTEYDSFKNDTGEKLTKKMTVTDIVDGVEHVFTLVATMPIKAVLNDSILYHSYDDCGKIANNRSGFSYIVNDIRLTEYSTIYKDNSEQYIANSLRCDVYMDSESANKIIQGGANKQKSKPVLDGFEQLKSAMGNIIGWASRVRGAFSDNSTKVTDNQVTDNFKLGRYNVKIASLKSKGADSCTIDGSTIIINKDSVSFKNGIDPKTVICLVYLHNMNTLSDINHFASTYRSTVTALKKVYK